VAVSHADAAEPVTQRAVYRYCCFACDTDAPLYPLVQHIDQMPWQHDPKAIVHEHIIALIVVKGCTGNPGFLVDQSRLLSGLIIDVQQ